MPGTGMRDFDIHRELLSELDWTQDVHSTEIGVQVAGGIVTLSGVVESPLKKGIAVEAAHRVEGVRAVIDLIAVYVPTADEQTDLTIARNTAAALEHLNHDPANQVRITVSRGLVKLTGQVATRQQRIDAEQYVREVSGIIDILNGISVVGTEFDTGSIQHSIENSFQRLAEQAARRISIESDGASLVLKGTVDTWAERDEAERAAHAAGAAHVDNQIQVHPHIEAAARELVYIAG